MKPISAKHCSFTTFIKIVSEASYPDAMPTAPSWMQSLDMPLTMPMPISYA